MCYCEAIETYVRQCTSRGITINWRVKTDECRKLLKISKRVRFLWGRVTNFNQSGASKHCFLASDWSKFETLPR